VKFKKPKKGQLGTLFEWIPATILLFIIMLVFIIIVGLMVGQKGLTYSGDSLKISSGVLRVDRYNNLDLFLNILNEEGLSMKEEIFYWAHLKERCLKNSLDCDSSSEQEKKIRERVKNEFDEYFGYQYGIQIVYGEESVLIYKVREYSNARYTPLRIISLPFGDSVIKVKYLDVLQISSSMEAMEG
jgi:hypothetical protein